MSVQSIIVALVVASALAYIALTLRRQIGAARRKNVCGDDCGCGKGNE